MKAPFSSLFIALLFSLHCVALRGEPTGTRVDEGLVTNDADTSFHLSSDQDFFYLDPLASHSTLHAKVNWVNSISEAQLLETEEAWKEINAVAKQAADLAPGDWGQLALFEPLDSHDDIHKPMEGRVLSLMDAVARSDLFPKPKSDNEFRFQRGEAGIERGGAPQYGAGAGGAGAGGAGAGGAGGARTGAQGGTAGAGGVGGAGRTGAGATGQTGAGTGQAGMNGQAGAMGATATCTPPCSSTESCDVISNPPACVRRPYLLVPSPLPIPFQFPMPGMGMGGGMGMGYGDPLSGSSAYYYYMRMYYPWLFQDPVPAPSWAGPWPNYTPYPYPTIGARPIAFREQEKSSSHEDVMKRLAGDETTYNAGKALLELYLKERKSEILVRDREEALRKLEQSEETQGMLKEKERLRALLQQMKIDAEREVATKEQELNAEKAKLSILTAEQQREDGEGTETPSLPAAFVSRDGTPVVLVVD